MRYCKKCGNRIDDFDGYCSRCGAKVDDNYTAYSSSDTQKNNNKSDKISSIEDAINNVTEAAKENFESFICILLGIFSVTFGTFICGIISLVFYNMAKNKGQTDDDKCAIYCKVGKICSIISIILWVVIVVLLIVCLAVVPIIVGT